MVREPLVLDTEDIEHILDLLEALADGFHINNPGPEKQQQYRAMHERMKDARIDLPTPDNE